MNFASLIGRLTRDTETRYSNDTAVTKFTLAVDSGYGEKKKTAFIPIVVFGKTAENCSKYLSKGSKVAVTGRIQTGSYEKDGRTIFTTDVLADNVEFLDSKSSADQEDTSGFQQTFDETPF